MPIIRSVTNISLHILDLFVPGYDTLKPAVTIAPSATLDLFTVLDAEQLSAIQVELNRMISEGSLSAAGSVDSDVVDLVGTSVKLGHVDFTNVSADIGTTTVYIPSVSGMYLYSFYGTTTVNAGSQFSESPNLYLRWTDEGGAQANFTYAGNLDGIHSDGANQLSIPIWAMAGTPITFNTASGNYATARWSFHLTVTQL